MTNARCSATLLALAGLLAAAETAPAPAAQAAPALALSQAITMALARNETPEIAASRCQQALARLRQARSSILPQLNLQGSLSTKDENAIPNGDRADETAAWSAQADLTLFNPRAWAGIRAARLGERAQTMSSLEMRRNLAFSVTDNFLTIIAAEKQVDAAQRRRQVAESAVGDAKARLQAGLTTRTDVTRAELSLAEADLTVTRSKRNVTASRLSLADLIVNPVEGDLAMPETVAVPGRDGKALFTLGIAFRADLKALQYQEMAADATVGGELARYVPTVGARATVSSHHTTTPIARNLDDRNEVELALLAQWTLFDGGNREASIASARGDRREAGLNRSQQLRGLRRDVDIALADLATAESAVAQAEARDRLAKANAEEVRARYRQGLATALEDADAISSQFEAESNLVSARLDLERSRLGLRQLVGYWPVTDHDPQTQP